MIMNFAIMATGAVADTMAYTLSKMCKTDKKLPLTLYAVASRDLEKAKRFAQKWGFRKAYGSYQEMAQDPDIDLVYIATPHSHHYECARMCLTNGKHALVEKAFTVNTAQAKELVRLSEEKHLLLADAFWTRYLPAREMIDDILKKGIIGEITSIIADFGLPLEHTKRLTEPSLAGGALLDLGVYPLNFALMFCKSPVKQVAATAVMSEKGVDLANSITLIFESGVIAVLHSNMRSLLRREGVIYGKKGHIVVRGINCVQDITVYDHNEQVVDYRKAPECITNYQYEIIDCVKALTEGKLECDKMPHSETLRMMELLDLIRAQWNMKFPCE